MPSLGSACTGCELPSFLCAQVPTTSPSSPGPQEPEKGERRLWPLPPVAVALKPALQQSREAGEEALGGPPPVLCGSSTDLGLLLGPSFQSQHSFQPLEPKLTSSSGKWGPASLTGALSPLCVQLRQFPSPQPSPRPGGAWSRESSWQSDTAGLDGKQTWDPGALQSRFGAT